MARVPEQMVTVLEVASSLGFGGGAVLSVLGWLTSATGIVGGG